MKRRDVLRAAPVTAFAGCLTVATPSPDGPRVTITNVDSPAGNPLGFSVSVTQPSATDAHPPELAFVRENPTDVPVEVEYGYPRNGGFHAFESEERQPGAVVAAKSLYRRADVPENCWQLPRGPYSINLLPLNTYTLLPGESKRTPLVVLGHWTNETATCLPTGEFRVAEDVLVNPSAERDYEDSTEFTWGFDFEITDS